MLVHELLTESPSSVLNGASSFSKSLGWFDDRLLESEVTSGLGVL